MTFNSDLAAGQAAEAYLIQKYAGKLIPSTDRKWDLTTLSGDKIEIKLERRKASELKNLFVESIANDNKGTLGGPYRSYKDKIKYFGWLVSDSKELYLFETDKLVEIVDLIIAREGLKPKKVRNTTYNTLGYAVKIEWLLPYRIDILDIL